MNNPHNQLIGQTGLRPHGRSGLKFVTNVAMRDYPLSPPTRAEWVEIHKEKWQKN